MLNLKILETCYTNKFPFELEEKPILMEVNENTVEYFKETLVGIGWVKKLKTLIHWSDKYEKLTYENYYEYIKSNVNNFVEYVDKYNNKYLINSNLCAGAEKYDWGICIRFISGETVCLEQECVSIE
jgi:hypothetical protein